jgi:hypothetical protein
MVGLIYKSLPEVKMTTLVDHNKNKNKILKKYI